MRHVTSLYVYVSNTSHIFLFICREVREGIIRCILATDMARHNEILTQFREIISIFDFNNASHKNLVSFFSCKHLNFNPRKIHTMNSYNYCTSEIA